MFVRHRLVVAMVAATAMATLLNGSSPARGVVHEALPAQAAAEEEEDDFSAWHERNRREDARFPDRDRVVYELGRHFGDRYASSWFSWTDDGYPTLNVGVVNATEEDRRHVAEISNGNDFIRVIDADYGFRELEAYKAVIETCALATGAYFSIDAQESVNRVVLRSASYPRGLDTCLAGKAVPEEAWIFRDDYTPARLLRSE